MKIYDEATNLIKNFKEESVEYIEGNSRSTGDVIKMCDFYNASKHLSGDKDGLGRYKPFYNILNFRVTVAKVATDLDIKDIQITSDNPEHNVKSMLLQRESYQWMKKTGFDMRLNEQGRVRPKYGGVVVKKVEKEGELYVETVKWKNFACDQISFEGTKVEQHWLTPKEMMEKEGKWNNVRQAIKHALDKNAKERARDGGVVYQSDRIQVLEVHGTFPKAFLKEVQGKKPTEEDNWTYTNQVYFMLGCDDDYILFADEEKESPYMYLPWEEVDGRMLGRGVMEEGEEAQIWTNDTVINQKNALDLASRVAIKTNAKQLGNNMLEVDNGKIFSLGDNEDMNVINMTPSALGFLDGQIALWEKQANNATSVYESNTGEQAPSNTPYSQTALLNQVASKPFDYRREEHGIFLTQIFEKWVIPHLVKKLKKKHVLVSEFSDEELEFIDEDFMNSEARTYAKELLLEGKTPTPEAIAEFRKEKISQLRRQGKNRYIEIPDGYFDDIEAKVSVITTGEQRNKAAVLTSLSSILQTVSQSFNPQTGQFTILENPVLNRIFGQIVEIAGAGVSPISLRGAKGQASPLPTEQLDQMAQQATA